jgi:regulatory protein
MLDLENRFRAWNVKKEDWDALIDKLIEQNFLNEKRYIEAFVRGKFLIKKWGKIKIKAELNQKRIYGKEIDEAMENEIEEDEYFKTIKQLIIKKKSLLNEKDKLKEKEKLYRYLLSKGYEQELIFKYIT